MGCLGVELRICRSYWKMQIRVMGCLHLELGICRLYWEMQIRVMGCLHLDLGICRLYWEMQIRVMGWLHLGLQSWKKNNPSQQFSPRNVHWVFITWNIAPTVAASYISLFLLLLRLQGVKRFLPTLPRAQRLWELEMVKQQEEEDQYHHQELQW